VHAFILLISCVEEDPDQGLHFFFSATILTPFLSKDPFAVNPFRHLAVTVLVDL